MNDFTPWHNETLGKRAVEALRRNGFDAVFCPTAADAVKAVLDLVPGTASVGMGGSWTVSRLGLPAKLAAKGCEILDHANPALGADEKLAMRRRQLLCDVFLTGTNAVTLDGELVNTDGFGNRVAAMIFGPGKVIVVAGANKVVRDVAQAEERIMMVAAPLNNRRLNTGNPCTKTGECMDCDSPSRICNVTTVMHKRPRSTDIHVILLGEELGF